MKKAKKLKKPSGKEIIVHGPTLQYNSHVGFGRIGKRIQQHLNKLDTLNGVDPKMENRAASTPGSKPIPGRGL